jgi:hypothetical protein
MYVCIYIYRHNCALWSIRRYTCTCTCLYINVGIYMYAWIHVWIYLYMRACCKYMINMPVLLRCSFGASPHSPQPWEGIHQLIGWCRPHRCILPGKKAVAGSTLLTLVCFCAINDKMYSPAKDIFCRVSKIGNGNVENGRFIQNILWLSNVKQCISVPWLPAGFSVSI